MGEQRQVYELTVAGRHHRVETSVGDGWRNHATWWVDGEQIATARSASEDNLYLSPERDHELAASLGAVRARFTSMSKPLRATWFEGNRDRAMAAARIGAGGVDLVPEPGSPAAHREERMRAHPHRYAARHVAGGVGKVVVPIAAAALAAWLLSRVSWPDWDLGLPTIPWPDLPSIPWPDVPWPDIPLPSVDLPDWLAWLLEKLQYVWPVLLGLWLARREVRRRREQDAIRARMGGPGSPRSAAGDVPPDQSEAAQPEQDETAQPRDE